MALSKIDELNKPIPKEDSDFYAEYFGGMDLPEEEIEERIELANKFESVFLFILALILADSGNGEVQTEEYYANLLYARYLSTAKGYYGEDIDNDGYISRLAESESEIIVNETVLRIADEYYTSAERSMVISANETNSVANYHRELAAIDSGKTRKRWKTKMDGKERKEHKEANGQTVGIYETFKVGGERMLFPHDTSQGATAKNIVNCRCVAEYF